LRFDLADVRIEPIQSDEEARGNAVCLRAPLERRGRIRIRMDFASAML
jgi:hypothetical protein